jgi:hypothetical protein
LQAQKVSLSGMFSTRHWKSRSRRREHTETMRGTAQTASAAAKKQRKEKRDSKKDTEIASCCGVAACLTRCECVSKSDKAGGIAFTDEDL